MREQVSMVQSAAFDNAYVKVRVHFTVQYATVKVRVRFTVQHAYVKVRVRFTVQHAYVVAAPAVGDRRERGRT